MAKIKRKIIWDKSKKAKSKTPAPAHTPTHTPAPAPQATSSRGAVVIETFEKFRRLKDGVNKVSRFERDLLPPDRDAVIRLWNDYQRLIPDDDPICSELAEQINSRNRGKPLSSMQVAGYFSYLCRLGMWTEVARTERINLSLRKGRFGVAPVFSPDLIRDITRNWEHERADEEERRRAHAQLRRAKAAGRTVRIKVSRDIVSVLTPERQHPVQTRAPVQAPAEDLFQIQW